MTTTVDVRCFVMSVRAALVIIAIELRRRLPRRPVAFAALSLIDGEEEDEDEDDACSIDVLRTIVFAVSAASARNCIDARRLRRTAFSFGGAIGSKAAVDAAPHAWHKLSSSSTSSPPPCSNAIGGGGSGSSCVAITSETCIVDEMGRTRGLFGGGGSSLPLRGGPDVNSAIRVIDGRLSFWVAREERRRWLSEASGVIAGHVFDRPRGEAAGGDVGGAKSSSSPPSKSIGGGGPSGGAKKCSSSSATGAAVAAASASCASAKSSILSAKSRRIDLWMDNYCWVCSSDASQQ